MPQQTHLPDVWTEARALRDADDLDGARLLLEDSLDTGTFQYGEDHPDVLATAHLLATMHRRAADLTSARRVLEEALHAGSLRHSDDEPIMLRLSFELARVADELGNRHEARKHYTRIVTHGQLAPGFAEPVREALAWLGPQAPTTANPTIGGYPADPPPQWPLDPSDTGEQPAITRQRPAGSYVAEPYLPEPYLPERDDSPLPSLSGPLRFPERPDDEEREYVRFVPEAVGPVPVALPLSVFQPQATVVVERRGRGPMIAAIAAAVTAVLAAGVAVIVMLGGGDTPAASQTTAPPASRQLNPPSGVALVDNGSAITITWTDPGGTNGFAVMMGPTADELRLATQNLGVVKTKTINGLNTKFNYCIQVIAIYSPSDQPVRSETVCTDRSATP